MKQNAKMYHPNLQWHADFIEFIFDKKKFISKLYFFCNVNMFTRIKSISATFKI